MTDAERTRPYYLPFNKSSWLLYATDFDPDATDLELATYLFFHTERLCLTKSPAAAHVQPRRTRGRRLDKRFSLRAATASGSPGDQLSPA